MSVAEGLTTLSLPVLEEGLPQNGFLIPEKALNIGAYELVKSDSFIIVWPFIDLSNATIVALTKSYGVVESFSIYEEEARTIVRVRYNKFISLAPNHWTIYFNKHGVSGPYRAGIHQLAAFPEEDFSDSEDEGEVSEPQDFIQPSSKSYEHFRLSAVIGSIATKITAAGFQELYRVNDERGEAELDVYLKKHYPIEVAKFESAVEQTTKIPVVDNSMGCTIS